MAHTMPMECTLQQAYSVSSPDVCDYVCVFEEEDLVIAVVLRPLYGRSARQDVLCDIAATAAASSGTTVYVTCDLDLYRQVKQGRTGQLRRRILSRGGVVLPAP